MHVSPIYFQNKTPFLNQDLKSFLSTKEGEIYFDFASFFSGKVLQKQKVIGLTPGHDILIIMSLRMLFSAPSLYFILTKEIGPVD